VARGKRRGRGISYYFEASGGPPGPEPTKIRFTENGAVEVYLATQSNGQGHETVFPQIVSERLGVPYESVIVKQGDTHDELSGGGTVGSRSLQTAGRRSRVRCRPRHRSIPRQRDAAIDFRNRTRHQAEARAPPRF
jgi:carbon-monoxide dehydrogenase large subunit